MKYLQFAALTVLLVTLSACSDGTSHHDVVIEDMPEGLKDCKAFQVYVGTSLTGKTVTVFRCPSSETTSTHSCGKGCTTSTTVSEGSPNVEEDTVFVNYKVRCQKKGITVDLGKCTVGNSKVKLAPNLD